MEIGGVSSFYGVVRPQKPTAPQPPAGGNIENRQPPPEPQAPTAPAAVRSSGRATGSLLDMSV